MSKKLSCEQVAALLGFYADGTLNPLLHRAVKEHLNECEDCMADYMFLLEQYNNESKITEENNTIVETKQYEEFKINLSAYADNELDNEENLKIKKFAILNPIARQDLENIFLFKRILHSSYERTKNSIKNDYSKSIVNKIKNEYKHEVIIDPFYKISISMVVLIAFLLLCSLVLLYF